MKNDTLYNISKPFETKVIDVDKKDGEGLVKIQVSAFNNVDAGWDIMRPGAFKKTIKEWAKRIKHLKDHNIFQVLGLPLEMEETGEGLVILSAMNINKSIANDVYIDYKFFADHNRTLEHSIGYDSIKDNYLPSGVREILEVRLYEYSTISLMGMNENTPLLEMKSMFEKMYDTQGYSKERLQQIDKFLKRESGKSTPTVKGIDYKFLVDNFKI